MVLTRLLVTQNIVQLTLLLQTQELMKKVKEYFSKETISSKANLFFYIKAIIWLSLIIVFYFIFRDVANSYQLVCFTICSQSPVQSCLQNSSKISSNLVCKRKFFCVCSILMTALSLGVREVRQ